ncbi:12-oxophytodienoate reductase 2-like [Prosopis cineraria]|uniref:12-oxophytodienoate reductase 2-like n=1 Tax=Prosopis cineraria TaxID=364024 RepID=UPI00240F79F6|nr:12-oxophytodienoate reductase 2-like [Prosopis cineraria]
MFDVQLFSSVSLLVVVLGVGRSPSSPSLLSAADFFLFSLFRRGGSERHPRTPGIWIEQQMESWKPIVDAVHDKGGIFFVRFGTLVGFQVQDFAPREE